MPDQFDVDKQDAVSREQLQTAIPERLQNLRDALDSSKDRVEDWLLFEKILGSVARVCRDLLQTINHEEALPAAAWNARNLLELWVWAKYCSASPDNARRFVEDGFRDILGFSHSLSSACELVGVQNEFAAWTRKQMESVPSEKTDVKSLDSKFLRVAQAAEYVGLDGLYSALNKHLSKFAHPTALLVLTHEGQRLRHYQSVYVSLGVCFANKCVAALEEFVSAIPTEGRGVRANGQAPKLP